MILSPYQKPPLGSTINWGHPLARGLVGSWLMNEGSGNLVQDYSGNGNHGTCMNMSPQSATSGWGPGPHGSAVYLDGSNDYIVAGVSPILRPTAFTISVTFTLLGVSASNYQAIVSNTVYGHYYGYGLMVGPAAKIRMSVQSSSASSYTAIPNDGYQLSFNRKYIVMVTYNYRELNLYIDNILVAQVITPVTIAYETGDNFRIGSFAGTPGAGAYFNGLVSDVGLYNCALTAQEGMDLYRSPYCMFNYDPYPAWMYPVGGSTTNPRIIDVSDKWCRGGLVARDSELNRVIYA